VAGLQLSALTVDDAITALTNRISLAKGTKTQEESKRMFIMELESESEMLGLYPEYSDWTFDMHEAYKTRANSEIEELKVYWGIA